MKGIPVCNPAGQLSIKSINCYHANCDSFDLINKKEMENNVKYTSMLALALASEKELPVKVKNEDETKAYLISQNLKEQLILGESWPWKD
mgnify:CR=1 FL=1